MAEVQHLLEFQWTTFYHAQTSQSRRLEVFIFRRRGCGGSFPSSLTVLTSSNNASLKISVRQNSPCKWKLLIACEEYIRLKWKENKLIILKFDFFFLCHSRRYKLFANHSCNRQRAGILFWKRWWTEDHKNNWRLRYVLQLTQYNADVFIWSVFLQKGERYTHNFY